MSEKQTKDKLWGGRFSESTERQVELFTASLEHDKRFYAEDIEASVAHVKVLLKAQVVDRPRGRVFDFGFISN